MFGTRPSTVRVVTKSTGHVMAELEPYFVFVNIGNPDKVKRQCKKGDRQRYLMLPTLLLRAQRNPKRLDDVLDQVVHQNPAQPRELQPSPCLVFLWSVLVLQSVLHPLKLLAERLLLLLLDKELVDALLRRDVVKNLKKSKRKKPLLKVKKKQEGENYQCHPKRVPILVLFLVEAKPLQPMQYVVDSG